MRVQLRHLIEQFLVGCRGFLHPIEVLQVTSASPKGFDRSPTIVFPGAVKTFTPSVVDATGAVTRVVSCSPFVPSIWYFFRCQSE
jgi:hypothetical protein